MGWHVIQLLNTRDRAAPTYEAVKDRLAQRVLATRLTKMSDELLKTAKIDPPLAPDAAATSDNPPATPAPGSPPAAEAPATTPPAN
jgi:hypothetical protein